MRTWLWLLLGALVALAACTRPAPEPLAPGQTPAAAHPLPRLAQPGAPATLIVPTPDATGTPAPATDEIYLVQAGDTLSRIALEYGTTVEDLVARNAITDADHLRIGQPLLVAVRVDRVGPSFKIVPDSELVYGPASTHFDIAGFVDSHKGYLKDYKENVDGRQLAGAQIVQLAAQRYSVGPRLLLAMLEYQDGWVTQPVSQTHQAGERGLLNRLTWLANLLNDGYYGWKERGYTTLRLGDGGRVRIAPGLNAGTVGVQEALGMGLDYAAWQKAVGPEGVYATYVALFGDPFAYAIEPLLPAGLAQPVLRLPWSDGETWYYTGGPHGGWGSGSAWAALDFTPPGEALGCYDTDFWVTSASAGAVVRSGDGVVVVDLDGDGFEQTGWTLFYLHVGTPGRAPLGTQLLPGDRIGHPSCEGGLSNGTHIHLARRFNGQWITADGPIPFVLSGWQAKGALREYDGVLVRGSVIREACECRDAKNGLTAGAD